MYLNALMVYLIFNKTCISQKMKRNIKPSLVAVAAVALLATSCKKEKDGTELSGSDYLVFGHYYGMCAGEECVEVFRLENDRLLEDRNDTYPPQANGFYVGDYEALPNALYNDVKDLADYFPQELLDINDRFVGTPDAADGGGLYIEYNHNGAHRCWLLDQTKAGVSQGLHGFMDKVNEKIAIINQ